MVKVVKGLHSKSVLDHDASKAVSQDEEESAFIRPTMEKFQPANNQERALWCLTVCISIET